MIDLNEIRLAFRSWMSVAGVDLTLFAWENMPASIEEKDVIVEEVIESFGETTNTSIDNVLRGMVTYYISAKKGLGTNAQSTLVKQIGDVFQPATRKDQTIDTTIRLNIERTSTTAGSDFQSDTASRWRIPLRVEFRAYENA